MTNLEQLFLESKQGFLADLIKSSQKLLLVRGLPALSEPKSFQETSYNRSEQSPYLLDCFFELN